MKSVDKVSWNWTPHPVIEMQKLVLLKRQKSLRVQNVGGMLLAPKTNLT
jgi:hypothetical protein